MCLEAMQRFGGGARVNSIMSCTAAKQEISLS